MAPLIFINHSTAESFLLLNTATLHCAATARDMVNSSPDAGHNAANQHNGSRGEKRIADDENSPTAPTHTRSKRNRYISIACNECKRRKIKCNGQSPCQRCGNLSLDCVYAPNCCTNSLKDSEEFQRMRELITTLQEQVSLLWDNVNELRCRQEPFQSSDSIYPSDANGQPSSMAVSRTLPPLISPKRLAQKPLPRFHGPTSSTYGFDVARSSLQTMGITQSTQDDGLVSRDRSGPASPMPTIKPHPTKDPIWLIDQTQATRLCKIYEEEVHIMYPILDLDKLTKHVNMLYSFLGAALRTGLGQTGLPGEDAMDDDQTTILKMVLAIASVIEGNGKSDFGQKLFDSAKLAVDMILIGPLTLKSVILIVLTKDEETQAWRFIGIAGRLCVELGLHRKDSLLRSFTNEAEYTEAVRIFWVVYALDRRWSFGTGMPFSLQDSDIDSTLPEPDDAYPYLKYITKHNKIATKIWQHNAAFESGNPPKTDEIGFLDYQILQWYQQLPDSLKFDIEHENEISNRGLRRLRFLMYLRKNQARISIYRPIMHSATSIIHSRGHAETIVSIAKDTINVITGVNRISDIYRTQQVCYNYFLIQALAAIFLAVAHAPAMFCHTTRDEFYAAIDLIRGFSTKSHTSKRLWSTIRGLKEIVDKIGMLNRPGIPATEEQDAHSNAAMAMADLAGHKIDDFSYNRTGRGEELGISPHDSQQMGVELAALFEMAGAYGSNYHNIGGEQNRFNEFGQVTEGQMEGDILNGFLGNEPELTRIMNDLF